MKRYTVKKGRHWSLPFTFKSIKNPEIVTWKVIVDSGAIYILDGNDQLDWNKALGVKKNYFKPQEYSFMLGHRWNPDSLRHEFTPYIHIPGEPIVSFKNKDFWFDTEIDAEFMLEIIIKPTFVRYLARSSNGEISDFIHHFDTESSGRWWHINTWFGGNRKAPKDYSILKRFFK
jgi:hypothetical protein